MSSVDGAVEGGGGEYTVLGECHIEVVDDRVGLACFVCRGEG